MKKSIHSGHRRRVREKFLSNEFEGFNDHEILELVLFYAIPMKDTNPLAHELLNRFGSVSSILDADPKELKNFGLTDRVITYLNTLPKICQGYIHDKSFDSRKPYSESSVRKRLIAYSLDHSKINFIFSLYDAVSAELFFGGFDCKSSPELIGRVNRLAVKYNASSASICNIMKNGVAYPSEQDIGTASIIVNNLNNKSINI